jgi:integrase
MAFASEWEALLEACVTDMQRSILSFAVETGLREQELCQLQWLQVDLFRKQISLLPDVVDLKTDEPRVIPLTEAAVLTLANTPRSKATAYVFWHQHRLKVGETPVPTRFKKMSQWWKGVRRRSKVKNFRFHDIRHTFASNWLNDGGDMKVLQHMLGHSSISTTERYAHMVLETVRAQVRNIDKTRSNVP